jgi:hypothetical protein
MFFCRNNFILIFLHPFTPILFAGELAQLARAIAWHAIGQGFDSPILHDPSVGFFYYFFFLLK